MNTPAATPRNAAPAAAALAPAPPRPGRARRWRYQPAGDLDLPLPRRLRSVRRESGLLEAAAHRAWSAAVRAALRRRWRLQVVGRENLPPAPPFVLVANHTSHLDALVLAAALPAPLAAHALPIAAGDVFFHRPALAALSATLLNLLPMWREHCGPHALADLRHRLRHQPCGYILFPEGGRSRDGTLRPFKAGLGMLVAQTPVPVVPCRIEGAFAAWPPDAPRPRLARTPPIRLTIGRPLAFPATPHTRPGWRHVAATTHQVVANLSQAQ